MDVGRPANGLCARQITSYFPRDYGFYLLAMGQVNETTAELDKATALDPLSLNIKVDRDTRLLFAAIRRCAT
jgi:hypothetical protein